MKRMIQKLYAPLGKPSNAQKGFTLLEILVVLVIMGFLVAMVAPRLAGVSSSAVDTVCDSNQNRMLTMMSTFFEQTNRMPNRLVNIVVEDGAATPTADYLIPTVSNQDPDDGPETLAEEFNARNNFKIHYLNAAEAAELAGMGIVTLLNLNSYDNNTAVADDDQQPAMREQRPEAGVGVAMVGMGIDDGGDWDGPETERGWGEPDWLGRIVLGFGPENSLVTSGIVTNAAHCPGGLRNTDNATYNYYNLVLPRLQATVDRFGIDTTDTPTHDLAGIATNTTTADGEINLDAVAYDDEPGTSYVIADNDDNLKVREFNIAEVQEGWQYATQCPEGHMFPADDEEFWGIDFNNGGTIE
jgi:prepilin-type N-terminal cleavage/methylation domain-containing protein